jgi:8-oxo-dGTP pyrophosphatase MutT (NUDIX family)
LKKQINGVAIFIVDTAAKEIFLMHRDEYAPSLPDTWSQHGGAVEKTDKSILAAAVREVEEETGVSLHYNRFELLGQTFRGTAYFVAYIKPEEKGQFAFYEGDDARWFSFDQVTELPKFEKGQSAVFYFFKNFSEPCKCMLAGERVSAEDLELTPL